MHVADPAAGDSRKILSLQPGSSIRSVILQRRHLLANGIRIRWEGTGLEEKGYDVQTGKMLVCVNPAVVPPNRRR